MRFIINVLFLAIIVTASTIKPDVAPVVQSLQVVNAGTVNLTIDVNNYNGNPGHTPPFPKLFNTTVALAKYWEEALANIHQIAGSISEADFQRLGNYITGTLEPNTILAVSALTSKASLMSATGLAYYELNYLNIIQVCRHTFGANLIRVAPNDLVSQAEAINNTIWEDWNVYDVFPLAFV